MKKITLTTTSLLSLLFSSSLVFAHGEEKPGPHGGVIRMPGAFHTELTSNSDTKFNIYLLDINWENPSIKDSHLEIKIINNSVAAAVTCKKDVDFFQCQLPKNFTLKKGKLSVKSSREKEVGREVFYDLPLNLSSSHGSHQSHEQHH